MIDQFENGMLEMLKKHFLGKLCVVLMDQQNAQFTAELFIGNHVGILEEVTPWGLLLRHMKEDGTDEKSFLFFDKVSVITEITQSMSAVYDANKRPTSSKQSSAPSDSSLPVDDSEITPQNPPSAM